MKTHFSESFAKLKESAEYADIVTELERKGLRQPYIENIAYHLFTSGYNSIEHTPTHSPTKEGIEEVAKEYADKNRQAHPMDFKDYERAFKAGAEYTLSLTSAAVEGERKEEKNNIPFIIPGGNTF
jgi:hypothetical protein